MDQWEASSIDQWEAISIDQWEAHLAEEAGGGAHDAAWGQGGGDQSPHRGLHYLDVTPPDPPLVSGENKIGWQDKVAGSWKLMLVLVREPLF